MRRPAWTVHFEDLPEARADWDYNDAAIHVELSPVVSATKGSVVHGAGMSEPKIAVYDLLGRRVIMPEAAARLSGRGHARLPNGSFVLIGQGGSKAATVRVRGSVSR
jgi:hypothetical protein